MPITAKNDIAINALTDIPRQNISVESEVNNIKVALGNGNGKSFGAALNILSNDKNVAVNIGDNGYLNSKFADNISAFNNKISSLSLDNISDKTEIKILKINKAMHEKSDNTGTINSIAVAGTENSESHGFADGFNDKVFKGETFLNYADDSFKWLFTKLLDAFTIKDKNDKLEKSGEKKPTDAGIEAGEEAGNELSDGNNGAASHLDIDSGIGSQLNIANAGSAAININSGSTGSFISNANC